jgi:hypothetical protein
MIEMIHYHNNIITEDGFFKPQLEEGNTEISESKYTNPK